jgi:acyl carrier protein
MSALESQIRTFLSETFLFGESCDTLSSSESLLGRGIIDSTGVLELVGFVEQQFGFEVRDEELTPANFDSIGRLVAYVERKTARARALEAQAPLERRV